MYFGCKEKQINRLIWPASPSAGFWYTIALTPALVYWLNMFLKSSNKEYRRADKDPALSKGFIRELTFGA